MNHPTEDRIKQLIDEAIEECKKYKTCMALTVSNNGGAVELLLDTSRDTYGEHIAGEGADICLYRDTETGKVVGVRLPLMKQELSVFHDGPLKINDGFLTDDAIL
jgi:hypothetical protein